MHLSGLLTLIFFPEPSLPELGGYSVGSRDVMGRDGDDGLPRYRELGSLATEAATLSKE